VTKYAFLPASHAGGYDDLYFLNGKVFIAASNPPGFFTPIAIGFTKATGMLFVPNPQED
jgi:hypothetical protein